VLFSSKVYREAHCRPGNWLDRLPPTHTVRGKARKSVLNCRFEDFIESDNKACCSGHSHHQIAFTLWACQWHGESRRLVAFVSATMSGWMTIVRAGDTPLTDNFSIYSSTSLFLESLSLSYTIQFFKMVTIQLKKMRARAMANDKAAELALTCQEFVFWLEFACSHFSGKFGSLSKGSKQDASSFARHIYRD